MLAEDDDDDEEEGTPFCIVTIVRIHTLHLCISQLKLKERSHIVAFRYNIFLGELTH